MTSLSPGADGGLDAYLAMARPRVMAALLRYFRDLDAAEDAFQEACLRAVDKWPKSGLPSDPTAWLVLTGRNAGIDAVRKVLRNASNNKALPDPDAGANDMEAAYADALDNRALPDDVLRLLFLCCHPDLGPADQLALALKVVAGLSVAEIARAFVISPKAMEQRITRAKKRAASTAEGLETPSLAERTERLNAVSAMIYLMFNEGYSAAGGDNHIKTTLCDEAIRLARLLLDVFPAQPEVMGLLALCLFQNAREPARADANGDLVPLDRQDRQLWLRDQIAEGNVLLEKALRRGRPGTYQIQAAIAATHCAALRPEDTDWTEIARLYTALEEIQPTPVVALNRAVAVWKTKGPEAALELINPLGAILSGYLHFHTTRASLLREIGDHDGAIAAYKEALSLRPTDAERAHIERRIAAVRR